ncbi:hypothetical protein EJ06DRAFT_584782 [Trichodelitschia bisporula]|uniref:Uncharacterized protein n=1 Tax=Trichodelitschia bisporula TaxID=703511 RepID=A0A6G1HLP3_9PEZI|nr:hypothetical protein EJ06DRAFT_584782 [Trichodelitschia bisporula]
MPSLPPIPAPLKKLFNTFPLTTYGSNLPPQRSIAAFGSDPLLFTWLDPASDTTSPTTTPSPTAPIISPAAERSDPGRIFDPRCLAVALLLRALGTDVRIVGANAHASAEGLPLLINGAAGAGMGEKDLPRGTVGREGLEKWARGLEGGEKEKGDDKEDEGIRALVEGPVRRLWLYTMFLDGNGRRKVGGRYFPLLKQEAVEELTLSTPVIDGPGILAEGKQALQAIDAWILGQAEWEERNFLQVTVEAYASLLLKGGGEGGKMVEHLEGLRRLVARVEVLRAEYGGKDGR